MKQKTIERIKKLGLSEEEFKPSDITSDDILEIIAEQEYRICLLELGVSEDDL